MTPRPRCLRCRRPAALCYCRDLVPVATRTRIVLLQHPRERTMAMGTGRLAHLGLANSELHVGVSFEHHPRVRALAADPGGRAALLYPGPGTQPIDAAAADPPRTLVVVDGTWTTARKMLARNPSLDRLPRLAIAPRAPSAYRIRREPAAHCLSTVEAVTEALERLEGDCERFEGLRRAFESLVAAQMQYAATRHAPYRRERKWARPRRESAFERYLRERQADVVLVQAEGNPSGPGRPHELVQLAAFRPATGARVDLLAAPRGPLAPRTAEHLGLEVSALREGAHVESTLAAWNGFLRPADVLCGWGRFTPSVLAAEGVAPRPWLDLRIEVGRRLGRRAGGVEAAAAALGAAELPSCIPGRAGRRLEALAFVLAALRGASANGTPGAPAR